MAYEALLLVIWTHAVYFPVLSMGHVALTATWPRPTKREPLVLSCCLGHTLTGALECFLLEARDLVALAAAWAMQAPETGSTREPEMNSIQEQAAPPGLGL